MPRTPTRPGSITFVAIVLIILGSLSLLGGLVEIPTLAVTAFSPEPAAPPPPGHPDNAAIQRFLAKEVPAYYPVMFALSALSCLFGIGQLVCGIGLLKLKPSARAGAIWIILGKLLFAFAANAYQGFVVGPAQQRFFAENLLPAGQPAPFDVGAFMGAFLLVIVAITMVVQIAIALTLILILTSAAAKAAFSGIAPPQQGEDEEDEERPRSRYEGYEDDDEPPNTGITDRS